MKKTKNENLQLALDTWVSLLNSVSDHSSATDERKKALRAFAITFVPLDVNEEDSNSYADGLYTDDEYFESMRREMTQCSSGNGVQSIEGDQVSEAIFTLDKPEGDINIDIVREIAFSSSDSGVNWRAEG